MHHANFISPPPYSYENSSFAPPPPQLGQMSRSWDFQMKFEAAHEDVRWALLNTITAWEVSGTGRPWDHIPRNNIQSAYDSAPQDLKIALDYIVHHHLTCYFNNDTDRRRHLYFSRRDAGWPPIGGPRVLLSPDQFVGEYLSVRDRVQKAILRSIAWWDRKQTGRYQELHPSALAGWYLNASNERKIIINWALEVGLDYGIDTLRGIATQETIMRTSFDRMHQNRQTTRSITKMISP
ncbi:unnamed protein product [Peniophora sp. CBMAI 1063]|nr:unnamed protein product [Peniophora sp. CBMAI 1063]